MIGRPRSGLLLHQTQRGKCDLACSIQTAASRHEFVKGKSGSFVLLGVMTRTYRRLKRFVGRRRDELRSWLDSVVFKTEVCGLDPRLSQIVQPLTRKQLRKWHW